MNLDNLNLVEMSHAEMTEVEGGILIALCFLAGVAVGVALSLL
jgi:hypothetical protein